MRALLTIGLLAAAAAGQTDDSLNFRLLGTCPVPGSPVHVAVQGDIACVAAWDSGLFVVDVANPASPTVVGRLAIRPVATGVTIRGDYAYVTCRDSGLRVVSIADPANPVQVGHHDTPYWALHVVVVDTLAYVADFVAGLRIISVADPARPREVGSVFANRGASGVDVAGRYAYIADVSQLSIVDVQNPLLPVLVGSCSTYYSRYVAVVDTFAYVADAQGGMHVISVADPTRPRTVVVHPVAFAAHVEAVAGRVYLSAATRLVTFDPAYPGDPQPDGHYDINAMASASVGGLSYVVTGSNGLWVLERGTTAIAGSVPAGGGRSVLRLLSNPAAGTIRATCPAGVASVAVIDAAGRVVRSVRPTDGRVAVAALAPGVYALVPSGCVSAEAVRVVVR